MKGRNERLIQNNGLKTDYSRVPTGMQDSDGPLLSVNFRYTFEKKWKIERDAGRLIDCRARMKFSPLGACALAGTGLPIDRIDAVSDRDFLLEFLSANAITAVHLSQLGEEWVLWASEEFGFITPSDPVSTGSSIMPQKKNPDPMELVRGKSGRVIGGLVTLLTACKGLPHAYNRDLQEDEEPVFDSVRAILGMLEVSAEFAMNITFNRERIQKSLPAGFPGATTLADYLVKKVKVGLRWSHVKDVFGGLKMNGYCRMISRHIEF
ncbi:hypothetical protein KIW84_070180 [Lathyrus oleraceus]|uniref:argininosuccinate lyase n=1 Tax=Pisum sativum TaxID=3888 RepID=A0A9D4VH43_PEA|nr:hypothetical protein KIW84_UN0207 [Pisum sativum]KAI5382651.1 hypothetical protein KIW84_070180 [Pisum sativum]